MTFKIIVHDSMSSLRRRLENRIEPPLMMMRGIINEATQPGRMVIWCWDGKGGNDRRREIYPGYKNRPPTPQTASIALGMLRKLLLHTNCWQAKLDGFEGDDIVAAVVENFRGQAPIEIMSSDGDLTALCGPGVTCRASAPVPPNLIRLWKRTVGDKSDTIPGIRGFGPKDFENADKDRLGVLIQKVVDGGEWTDEEALYAGLRPPHRNWLRDNTDQLQAMAQIIEPMPLTRAQFSSALVQGVDNPQAREAVMKEFMQ